MGASLPRPVKGESDRPGWRRLRFLYRTGEASPEVGAGIGVNISIQVFSGTATFVPQKHGYPRIPVPRFSATVLDDWKACLAD